MTLDKDLKRVIRERMRKTGESYTAARAQLLSKPTPRSPRMSAAVMAERAGVADATIKARTGRSWPEWVLTLDADNAAALSHRDIARIVRSTHGIGDWWSQSVTVGYERIKGLREQGQRRDGCSKRTRAGPSPIRPRPSSARGRMPGDGAGGWRPTCKYERPRRPGPSACSGQTAPSRSLISRRQDRQRRSSR